MLFAFSERSVMDRQMDGQTDSHTYTLLSIHPAELSINPSCPSVCLLSFSLSCCPSVLCAVQGRSHGDPPPPPEMFRPTPPKHGAEWRFRQNLENFDKNSRFYHHSSSSVVYNAKFRLRRYLCTIIYCLGTLVSSYLPLRQLIMAKYGYCINFQSM